VVENGTIRNSVPIGPP